MLCPADSAPSTGLRSQAAQRLLIITYALTTLLSALLLFEVQPIISKAILPWFGGSPAVWTTYPQAHGANGAQRSFAAPSQLRRRRLRDWLPPWYGRQPACTLPL